MPSTTANHFRRNTLLVISQVYVPDPAAVGQHMHDAAAELARRGWRVVVYTADRGYDDPSMKYPSRETRDGVEIRRLPFCSFGKKSIAIRLLGQLSFVLQCMLRGVFVSRLSVIFLTTSPPMSGLAPWVIGFFRRIKVKYWVMDLNPDIAVMGGNIKEGSVFVRILDWVNRITLRQAIDVIALDTFMADRLMAKCDVRRKLHILPPWPLEGYLSGAPRDGNPFRTAHALNEKFVFMYSGNHSPYHPLNTILEAAIRLRGRGDIAFAFIGGGLAKRQVEALIEDPRTANVLSLPYQPVDKINESLSAADVHFVVVGDKMVGCVHPCKVYGAMAVGRPIVLVGPERCHVSELIEKFSIGWRVVHGDVDGAVATLEAIVNMKPAELRAIGERAKRAVETELSMKSLLARLCDIVERGALVDPAANYAHS